MKTGLAPSTPAICLYARWLDETRTESARINAWVYRNGKGELYKDSTTGRVEEDRFAIPLAGLRR